MMTIWIVPVDAHLNIDNRTDLLFLSYRQISVFPHFYESDLHELGDVQGEGEDGDGDDVDEQSLRVCHRL